MPLILQIEAAECGTACLAMILASHGRAEKFAMVRQACHATRDGISAQTLLQASETFGLTAQAYRCEPEDLAKLAMPQILHWRFGHFVVLEKARGGRFWLLDPAGGRRVVDRIEMGRSFTGATLCFQPGPQFRKTHGTSVLRSLAGTLRPAAMSVAVILVAGLSLTLLEAVVPAFLRIFVDEYLGRQYRSWMIPLLFGMVAVAGVRGLLTWMHAALSLFVQTGMTALLSSQMVWTVLRLPRNVMTCRSPVEVSARMQVPGQIAGLATGPLLKLVNAAFSLLVYGLLMVAYSPPLAALVLLISAVNGAVLYAGRCRLADSSTDAQMASARAHAAAVAGVALLDEFRASGAAPALFRRLMDAHAEEVNAQQRAKRYTARLNAASHLGSQLFSVAVLAAGSYEVMRSEPTIGGLLAFELSAELFAAPMLGLTAIGTALLTAPGAFLRSDDLLEAGAKLPPTASGEPFDGARLHGRVELCGVSFGYPGRPNLFHGAELSVQPGEHVLVVGRSGSGKSALAMLLAGICQPGEGMLLYDGVAAGSTPAETLRHSIGFVDQTPFFASAPLRDALSLWNHGATDEAFGSAMSDAAIEDVVLARPGGLDGRVGEAGAGFSGGELQRLGITRALLHRPAILVMDDATSALDGAAERLVLSNLRRRGLTVLMVSSSDRAQALFDRVVRIEGRALHDVGSSVSMQATPIASAA